MTQIILFIQEHLSPEETNNLFALWNAAYPALIAFENAESFQRYLDGLVGIKHYLLKAPAGPVQGWAFSFDRENERWFAILLSTGLQGRGYGKMLIDCLKQEERKLTAWVVEGNHYVKKDGSTYSSPLSFYLKNGFNVFSGEKSTGTILDTVKIRWTKE